MVSRKIQPEAYQQNAPGISMPFAAPVRGLNTRDSFIQLGEDEARELINWLPDAGSCTVRPGYSSFGSISGSKQVKTLARCVVASTTSLLAASNGSLYNVISGTPASLASGYTNDLWSTDFMNGYLFGVNGTDTPWRYDSSTVSATGFTGITLTRLRTVKNVQNRLWFTITNSGDLYYGPLQGVTGPLTLFQESQIAEGGICLAVFPWHDKTVFFYSTGQVLIYQGDPASGLGSGSDFTRVSSFYAPPLIEPDAVVKMGAELIALTQSGPISMDVIASGNAFNLQALGEWSKINPSWHSDWITYGGNAGWFGKFINGLMYFNVPTGTATTKQYVFNTRNQAWTTYSNLPIASMEYVNSVTYFGSSDTNGTIWQHSGGLDNGSQIVSTGRPGFSYLNQPGKKKIFTLMKPNIFSTGLLSAQMQIDVDFISSPITGFVQTLQAAGASTPWAQATSWGSSWSVSQNNNPLWFGAAAKGRSASAVIRTYSSGTDVNWYSTDVMTQFGSAL